MQTRTLTKKQNQDFIAELPGVPNELLALLDIHYSLDKNCQNKPQAALITICSCGQIVPPHESCCPAPAQQNQKLVWGEVSGLMPFGKKIVQEMQSGQVAVPGKPACATPVEEIQTVIVADEPVVIEPGQPEQPNTAKQLKQEAKAAEKAAEKASKRAVAKTEKQQADQAARDAQLSGWHGEPTQHPSFAQLSNRPDSIGALPDEYLYSHPAVWKEFRDGNGTSWNDPLMRLAVCFCSCGQLEPEWITQQDWLKDRLFICQYCQRDMRAQPCQMDRMQVLWSKSKGLTPEGLNFIQRKGDVCPEIPPSKMDLVEPPAEQEAPPAQPGDETIVFMSSDGILCTIPAASLEDARQRDPQLVVIR